MVLLAQLPRLVDVQELHFGDRLRRLLGERPLVFSTEEIDESLFQHAGVEEVEEVHLDTRAFVCSAWLVG